MTLFKGSGVALVTPFDEEGNIDFNVLEDLINFQIKNGTDALIICGTTGEARTMTKDEQISVVKFAVEKTNKRIPVIAGAGGNNTKEVVEFSKIMEDAGADGLLSVTPYYNKASYDGLIKHYHSQGDAVNIPIIVYNVPGRTGLNISPNQMKEISEHENIVGIKEASGDIVQAMEIRRLCPNLDIYSGNDDIVVPLMSIGGKGVISVLANIMPKETSEMCHLYLDGNEKEPGKKQVKYLKLIKALFKEVNPVPVKAALEIMGYNSTNLRLPLTKANKNTFDELKEILKELEVI